VVNCDQIRWEVSLPLQARTSNESLRQNVASCSKRVYAPDPNSLSHYFLCLLESAVKHVGY
jgi:hypothetical protein